MVQTVNTTVISEFSTVIYATLAGFVVGAVIKLIDRFVNRDKNELQMHVTLRKELREELDVVKSEVQRLQEELDEWKEKYYLQVELTNELKLAILNLNEELNDYKNGTHQ
jgi:hypothetical protein